MTLTATTAVRTRASISDARVHLQLPVIGSKGPHFAGAAFRLAAAAVRREQHASRPPKRLHSTLILEEATIPVRQGAAFAWSRLDGVVKRRGLSSH